MTALSAPGLARAADAADSPAPVATSGHWYGWQTLAVDAVAVGGLILNIERSTGETGLTNAAALPAALFWLGGPSIHAMHRRWAVAGASLALRIAVPILVGLNTGLTPEHEFSGREAGWGAIGGAVAIALLDGALAWESGGSQATAPPRAALAVGPTASVTSSGAQVGLVGVF